MTAEAVKERSRKKRTNTKASSSDMPHELPPIGEDDSEKADDKVHKSNQIAEKQRDSEIPKKSGIAIGAFEKKAKIKGSFCIHRSGRTR